MYNEHKIEQRQFEFGSTLTSHPIAAFAYHQSPKQRLPKQNCMKNSTQNRQRELGVVEISIIPYTFLKTSSKIPMQVFATICVP